MRYTFHISDGKIYDITKGLDADSEIKIRTDWEELRKLIVLKKEGKTSDGIKAFLSMKIEV